MRDGHGRVGDHMRRGLSMAGGAMLACAAVTPSIAGVFDPFVAAWHGSGTVKAFDGQTAAVRCKVDVTTEVGERASQELRCASTGYVIVVNASMRLEADAVVGSWSNDRGKSGGLKGTVSADSVDVMLVGEDVDARMLSVLDACKLTVTIEGKLGKISHLQVDLDKGC
ncbi:MAG: hypothetical protein KDJ68_16195 [Rhodobiaceae bacterium]|nr:hypothetical protein [Rhodobiaceae bacterium]